MATSVELPPEILGEIFLGSCSKPQDNDITRPNVSQSIITSSVCKYWREVSLSMPELWSKFRLYVPDSSKDVNTGPMIPLQLHLERSRDFPLTFILIDELSLYFQVVEDVDDRLVPYYTCYLDLLLNHAHHWGDAYILLSLPVHEITEFPTLHTLRAVDFYFGNRSSFLRAPNL